MTKVLCYRQLRKDILKYESNCQNRDANIVNLLLEKAPHVYVCDNDGFTPLIRSCSNNHTSIDMKHKPNINDQIYNEDNALFFSA